MNGFSDFRCLHGLTISSVCTEVENADLEISWMPIEVCLIPETR